MGVYGVGAESRVAVGKLVRIGLELIYIPSDECEEHRRPSRPVVELAIRSQLPIDV